MSLIETTSSTVKYRDICEDRVGVIHCDQRTIIVVADGAGGVGDGALAAETVLQAVQTNHETIHSADEWISLLRQIDVKLSTGETTAVVIDIRPYGIAGARVGDSQAWIIDDGEIANLTRSQNRKPMLGSGNAQPVGFTSAPLKGLLLVATDGLFDYAKRDEILDLVAQTEFYEIPRKCIELVQLPSGDRWDDIGIVVGRNKPTRKTRTTYEI